MEDKMPQSTMVFGLIESEIEQRRYSAALFKLTQISNQYSQNTEFLNLLAKTQKALGDYSALIKTLQVLCEVSPSIDNHLNLMSYLYMQGRLNESLDIALMLQEADILDSEKILVLRTLAKLYVEFTDYEGIDEIYNSFPLAQNDDVVLWSMGLSQLSAGKSNEALEFFRKAVSLNPGNDQAWISLSMLHEKMGDRELALANLDRAFDANPNNPTGIKLLSKWYRRGAEQTQKALDKVRFYLANYEFDEEVSLCYMQMLKENNEFEAMNFEAQKLILNNPSNSEFILMKKNIEAGMKTP